MKIEHVLKVIRKGVEEIIPEEELIKKLEKSAKTGKPLRIKYGIDPTGYDVHIGHLVPIRKMREFQDLGHTGVIIIGDFTAQIGDPTGRDESRPALTSEMVKTNSEKYMEQLFTVLDEKKTEVRWQSEWFGKMDMMDVLKLMGKFTLAQFMAHDTFRNRYEQGLPLGMHEIMYPILQGYDSVAINSDVELGATEQKFNILCGRDMQRIYGMEQQIAVLSPILIGTDGIRKMSKSFDNYISVFDKPEKKYYKIMSIPDSILMNYYTYSTGSYAPLDLQKVDERLKHGENPMNLKRELAYELVRVFDGAKNASLSALKFDKEVSKKELPDEIPVYRTNEAKIKLVKLLVDNQFCASNSEAKRMIMQNAVTVDGEKWTDVEGDLTLTDGLVIKVGKRKFLQIKKG
jgi:tyrosyl-tRNA synthetase